MNYKKIYDDLINNAKLHSDIFLLNNETERHHIIPKSLGGKNKNNIVKLTPREHFVAHWLLWKIYKNKEMAFAFHTMTRKNKSQKNRYINSRGYAEATKARSIMQSRIIKDRWNSSLYRQKMTEQSLNNWKNPEYRNKTSNSIKNKEVWDNIENIIKLRTENKTYRYIGKIYDVGHTTIMRIMKTHEDGK